MDTLGDMVGYAGMLCFLVGYFLMQRGSIAHTGLHYLGLNFVGSLLLMVSLMIHWNLPVFLLEAAWALISIQGIIKHVYPKKR